MDFYEIDFVKAGENSSGDAIALRYQIQGGSMQIHAVDGGYADDGQKLVDHITRWYGNPYRIDNVVSTHPDRDHAGGISTILDSYEVGALWMNRPWVHIDALMPRFEYQYTRDGLMQRLKRDFPNTAALEKQALELGIPIYDAFQGQMIGAFLVMSPSYDFYLDMIVASEKTPEPEREASILGRAYQQVREAFRTVGALWGVENLKGDITGTSAENETSIVQYGVLNGERILLTGDAGIRALEHAHGYALAVGISLPGIDKFQVPHHGARRNLSSDILDKWLGARLPNRPVGGAQGGISAVISAHENDQDHPKDSVVRALWHRGAHVSSTQGTAFVYWKANHQGWRPGTGPSQGLDYPDFTDE